MSRLPLRLPGATVAALVLTLSVSASAHDFWIRPATYHQDAPRPLAVGLLVGDHFEGVPYPRNPAHIASFVLVGPDGRSEVKGENGVDPAGLLDLRSEGTHVVGYRSHWSRVELEAEKFEDYLAHEGLDHVLRTRRETGRAEEPGREVFSRCAKALVCVGAHGHPDDERGFDTVLGMRLELVPESNPSHPASTAPLAVRLLFEGRPLADALVTAHHKDHASVTVEVRTDDEGRARLPLPYPGEWMLNSVHMIPAPEDSDADWESLWASLSFGVSEDPGMAQQDELPGAVGSSAGDDDRLGD